MRKRWRPPRLVGPLFSYDLIAATRRGQHTGLRILVALLLLATLYGVYGFSIHGFDPFANPFATNLKMDPKAMSELASSFVLWCMIVQFAAVILLTPSIVADAIAREKERRALEFLFVTDLSDREIILGKLGSRLAYLFGVILTGLPILALTMFFGGVSPVLLFLGYGTLLSTMVCLGSLSLYCSVVSSTSLRATAWSYAASIAYLCMCPCVLAALSNTPVAIPGMIAFIIANLVFAWVLVMVSIHELRPRAVTFLTTPELQVMTTVQPRRRRRRPPMVVAVAEVFESTTDDGDLPFVLPATESASHAPRIPADRGWDPADWRNLDHPVVWEVPELPRTPLPPVDERRPLLWKEVYLHSITGSATVGSMIVILAMLAVLLLVFASASVGYVGVAISGGLVKGGTVILGSLLGIGVLAHAVSSVTREWEKDTLDGLLTLPMHRDRILEAKWLGGLVSLRALAIALGGLWLFGLVTGGLHPVGLVCVALSVAAAVEFMASLGLWLSVICRTTIRANMAAALCVLLIGCGPWVASGYIDLFAPRGGLASPTVDAIMGAAMPLVAWVRACCTWSEYAKLPNGHFQTLLVGALFYATAAWALWRAAVGRFRKYGARRK
jgi:ABC-type transport system involved in multi-copper enzyme maturation permease subunit